MNNEILRRNEKIHVHDREIKFTTRRSESHLVKALPNNTAFFTCLPSDPGATCTHEMRWLVLNWKLNSMTFI